MERQSPPTDRVMRVLELFASVAPERLGLSAVARALGLSQSTCLGILNELARGGFLVRHAPGPTYSLGTALVLLGQAAQASLPGLEPASTEAAVLADELGVVCTVSAVVGREIVVLDRRGVSFGNEPFIESSKRQWNSDLNDFYEAMARRVIAYRAQHCPGACRTRLFMGALNRLNDPTWRTAATEALATSTRMKSRNGAGHPIANALTSTRARTQALVA